MSEKTLPRIIDQAMHYRNRDKFPISDLLLHAGQIVAWSFEGDRIVAHSKDPLDLQRQLIEQGLDEVVLEMLPSADELEFGQYPCLGGGLFNDPGFDDEEEAKRWAAANPP